MPHGVDKLFKGPMLQLKRDVDFFYPSFLLSLLMNLSLKRSDKHLVVD